MALKPWIFTLACFCLGFNCCLLVGFDGVEPRQASATPETTGTAPSHLDVVVAHCDRPIGWIREFVTWPISTMTVFSKCNYPVEGAPATAQIVRMENIGRCDHTYAHWLAQAGNRIPADRHESDLILFIKDNDMSARNIGDIPVAFEKMVRVASGRLKFACGRSWPRHSLYHISQSLMQFAHGTTVYKVWESKNRTRDEQTFTSSFKSFGEWATAMGIAKRIENQTLVPVCYGGTFLTTYSQIVLPPSDVWSRLETSLSRGDNIEEGHFAERSWAALLSNPLEVAKQGKVLSRIGRLWQYPMNGMLELRGEDVT